MSGGPPLPPSSVQRLKNAREYWRRFGVSLILDDVKPGDVRWLHVLYGYLDRTMPADVEQAIMHPGSSLRGITFDAVASCPHAREDEIPTTLRPEYWRRHWIQMVRQKKCTPGEFADKMMNLNE